MLAEAIDRVIEQSRRDDGRSGFFASDFGTCHRRMLLARAGVPGRPRSLDSLRTLDERQLLHDHKVRQLKQAGICIAGDSGTAWTNAHGTTRLSEGLPEGFGCRADAICHDPECCRQRPLPLTVAWGRMYAHYQEHGNAGCSSREVLRKHRLFVLEIKTTHPNLLNYGSSLPKPQNVLQARAAAYAVRKKYGLDLGSRLVYFAVGSGAQPLEFITSAPGDEYVDVEREITTLVNAWSVYQQTGQLPPVKPLDVTTRKEGDRRVMFYVRDWECSPLYCPYAPPEHEDQEFEGYHCTPLSTRFKTGDRFGYLGDNGQVVWVKEWCAKAGINPPLGVPVE